MKLVGISVLLTVAHIIFNIELINANRFSLFTPLHIGI